MPSLSTVLEDCSEFQDDYVKSRTLRPARNTGIPWPSPASELQYAPTGTLDELAFLPLTLPTVPYEANRKGVPATLLQAFELASGRRRVFVARSWLRVLPMTLSRRKTRRADPTLPATRHRYLHDEPSG
jgi:hypothetical protein